MVRGPWRWEAVPWAGAERPLVAIGGCRQRGWGLPLSLQPEQSFPSQLEAWSWPLPRAWASEESGLRLPHWSLCQLPVFPCLLPVALSQI